MNKNEIGKRIRQIRVGLGLSMAKFGEEIDKSSPVKSGVVSNWENGKQIPNNQRIKRIAELGNMTTNKLLYDSEFTYEDIEQNISTQKMKTKIIENFKYFFQNYLFYSQYNIIYAEKISYLLDLFIDELNFDFEDLIESFYLLVSDNRFTFYQHGVYLLLNEDFTKLHNQIYLSEYIYNLLVQLSLDYPSAYYKILLMQIDETKENIKEVSQKKDIYKDDNVKYHLAEFIDFEEYEKLFEELDAIKDRINSKKIIKDDYKN